MKNPGLYWIREKNPPTAWRRHKIYTYTKGFMTEAIRKKVLTLLRYFWN